MLWLMLTMALLLGVCNLYTQKIWLEDAVDDLRRVPVYVVPNDDDAAIARIMEQEHQDQEVLMLDLQMGGSY